MYDIVNFKYIDHLKKSFGTANEYASEAEQEASKAAEISRDTMSNAYYSTKNELGSAEDSISNTMSDTYRSAKNTYHNAEEYIDQ